MLLPCTTPSLLQTFSTHTVAGIWEAETIRAPILVMSLEIKGHLRHGTGDDDEKNESK